MNKKVIFFDIDGTLYDHDKNIPESTKRAVHLLKEKGHHLFIASGRSPFLIRPILEELGLDSFIAYNGRDMSCMRETLFTKSKSAAS
ncbi:hypothetical protein BSAF29S_04694 [Bacillus safensis subsp. safensis]